MRLVALLITLGTALSIIGGRLDSTPLHLLGIATLIGAMVIAYRRHRATRHNLPDWAAWLRRR